MLSRCPSTGCFGLTEPGTGSGAAKLAARAVRDGDSYVIDGTKMFITNGTWADVVLLFARTGGAPGHQGISAFLVPADSPGPERREIHGKLGLRGQATAELVLDGVRVPATAMLGPEGKGFSVAMSAPAKGRMSVAAGCVGIGQAALDAALGYAGERELGVHRSVRGCSAARPRALTGPSAGVPAACRRALSACSAARYGVRSVRGGSLADRGAG